jgi:hypothetical protein
MRIVVARRLGKRGEGLGNEAVAWAKGFIASQVLQATLVGPSWGINKRKYYRNFGTSRFDIVLEELLVRLPHYAFTEQDYRSTGEVELGRALLRWSAEHQLDRKSSFIATVQGMYGGYPAIRHARSFLWSKLLGSRDTLRNIHEVAAALDGRKLFVAVHMRLGTDFETLQEEEDPRGKFNMHVPPSWYLNVCAALKSRFGDCVQFHFFTDRRGHAFEEAVRRFNPTQKRQKGLTECSDLALMAHADLRVCSVSSYSMMASFLADGPYAWYEPQLIHENGSYTLWGHEPAQQVAGSLTMNALETTRSWTAGELSEELFRGWPVGHDGAIPPGLVAQLERRLRGKISAGDLLGFGAVPDWALRPCVD